MRMTFPPKSTFESKVILFFERDDSLQVIEEPQSAQPRFYAMIRVPN
jgi:hypothetical protein